VTFPLHLSSLTVPHCVVLASFAAPPPVLHAALFPLRELLERCRRSLDALPVAEAQSPFAGGEASQTAGDSGTPAAAAVTSAADGAGEQEGEDISEDVHWARTGLRAVCLALAEALPGDNESSAWRKAAAPSASRARRDDTNADAGAADGVGAVEGQSPSSASQQAAGLPVASGGPPTRQGGRVSAASSKMLVDGGGFNSGGSPAGEGCDASGLSGDGMGDIADHAGNIKRVENETGCVDDGGCPAALTTMMNLDDLERLLGAEGPCRAVSPGKDGVVEAATGVVDAMQSRSDRVVPAEDGCLPNAADGDGGVGGAWDLVEAWTPCAIGTLPGWSAVRLF